MLIPLSFYGNYLRNVQTICIGFLYILYGFLYIRRNNFLVHFTPESIRITDEIVI